MATATFRFHSVLESFIAREGRGHAFRAPCARDATVKHMIEALGVPHTEVALLLVDGAPSTASYMLAEGSRVEVYPMVPGVIPAAPAEPRFAADAHIGGLARLLRMAGFDTLYSNDIDDPELVAQAREGNRIVLTRDRDLLKRRGVERGCYLHSLRPEQQFGELSLRLELAGRAAPFSRCLACNTLLETVAKAAVAGACRRALLQRAPYSPAARRANGYSGKAPTTTA